MLKAVYTIRLYNRLSICVIYTKLCTELYTYFSHRYDRPTRHLAFHLYSIDKKAKEYGKYIGYTKGIR